MLGVDNMKSKLNEKSRVHLNSNSRTGISDARSLELRRILFV